ncbi:unnamed protein product [Tetraodon nigroviridis]|uniref:(spotted green pufferfish) hypothetical protein n=1 Tax=Tetraodon nigroviridis TaxID=99883 RepID=Q4RU36_TETNG|nr:unnamed protein product [Tetraodon nigroviridis]
MCGGCFPQAEQPAWPQLSKPQALGEDEEEKGGLEKEKGGLGGSSGESGELGKGLAEPRLGVGLSLHRSQQELPGPH